MVVVGLGSSRLFTSCYLCKWLSSSNSKVEKSSWKVRISSFHLIFGAFMKVNIWTQLPSTQWTDKCLEERNVNIAKDRKVILTIICLWSVFFIFCFQLLLARSEFLEVGSHWNILVTALCLLHLWCQGDSMPKMIAAVVQVSKLVWNSRH